MIKRNYSPALMLLAFVLTALSSLDAQRYRKKPAKVSDLPKVQHIIDTHIHLYDRFVQTECHGHPKMTPSFTNPTSLLNSIELRKHPVLLE